ncbi:transposase [Vaginella massiliensis]|uniref:transposase n=1 Tax=Vaginella massiliensis TaxID=1816680 RepID=UPI0008383A24|nr:transposase [Vaginella massiliensis]
MIKQLEDMWQYAQCVADEEDQDHAPPEFNKLDPEKIQQAADKINRILKNKSDDQKKKAKSRCIQKNFAPNLKKYQEQEAILKERNSYSKTDPDGCPLISQCFKGKNNRTVERNHKLEYHKQKARELLTSQIGEIRRKQRTADVEPTFAQLKHNRNFKRFTLKGIVKVEIEFGLHALAHNLKKMSA